MRKYAFVLAVLIAGCKQETLVTRYWQTDPIASNDTRYFPERDTKDLTLIVERTLPNPYLIGVCFSGGGIRSASATLGQLRALRHTGLLDHVGYISCVSGGSWAAIPFTFVSPDDDEDFLGKTLKTEDLTVKTAGTSNTFDANAIDQKKASLAAALCDTSMPAWLGIVPRFMLAEIGWHDNELFAKQLERALLRPFGLDGRRRFVTQDNASMDALMRNNPDLKRSDFIMPGANRPFLIANGTLRRYDTWPWDWASAHNKRLPIEMTPLYVGVPHTFHDVEENGRSVGGTYVEPAAYGATDVTRLPGQYIQAKLPQNIVPKHAWRFNVADMMAISGSAPAEVEPLANVAFSKLASWSADNPSDTSVHAYYHADGGLSENLGIMPLLARRVPLIIAFVNSEDRGVPDYVRELFGQHTGDPASVSDYGDWHARGVFPPEQLQDLQAAVSQAEAGGLPYLCQTYRVHGPAANDSEDCFNLHLKAAEIYNVKVAWFFLDARRWEKELNDKNPSVANWVENNPDLKNFPHYRTFRDRSWYLIKPTIQQVKVLAQMTSWLVETCAPDIKTKFDLDKGATTRP